MIAGQWLTVQDVAGLLQVRIETVRRWVRRGELPVLELGGPRTVYRIRPDDLDHFVWKRYRSVEAPSLQRDTSGDQTADANNMEPALPNPVDILGDGYWSLIDHIPAVTFRGDPLQPGIPSYLSREIETLLGYPLEDWSSSPDFWIDHVHHADREAVQHAIERTSATSEPFRMEFRMLARDNSVVWVLCDAVLVPTETGERMVLEGVLFDVTERKRIEAALGMRERQQKAVAELGERALEGADLATLLTQAVALATQALDVEYAKVFEVLPGGENLVLRASIGWQEGRIGVQPAPSGVIGATTISAHPDSQAGYTLAVNEPVISENLVQDDRFNGTLMAREQGVRSGMSVMIPGGGRPFGVFGAHSTQHRAFSPEDVFFLQSIANVIASVVARADTHWLTVTEVADLLQVTEETIRRWIRRTELPALNLGGPRAGYRIYPSDLERFIGERLSST